MSNGKRLLFHPFILDAQNHCLLRGTERVFLRSKSFLVLSCLTQHPQRLVTKDEILETVWRSAKVVDAVLRVSVQEIRKALGDDADNPRFIETVGKSGYRFIAPISMEISARGTGGEFMPFVGRGEALSQLRHHFDLAHDGKRQVVFVTGEPGIGKTTLVEAFTKKLLEASDVTVARGQCLEQFGAGEAFLPVLDALEQLCRRQEGAATADLLKQLAPTWLIDLPVSLSSEDREAFARECVGITAERRLREITAFLERIAKDHTLVLVLEDLQWVDPSTLGLISFLARRREAARLMVIGTCRGGEAGGFHRPLKNVATELTLHDLCAQLPLTLLSRGAVEEYLVARFNNPAVSPAVVSMVYTRSEGNPLFMIKVTDYLVSCQAIVREKDSIKLRAGRDEEPVPTTIRDLITCQFEALPEEDRELLETASVAGVTFPVLLIARLLGREREVVEQRCRELSEREQFLQHAGFRKRPSGTATALYRFTHALYHDVVYDRLGEARRRRLHTSMGEQLERVFQPETEQVAGELALHFDRGGDSQQAVLYHTQAAGKAVQQSAYQEALRAASKGLALVKAFPQSPNKTEMELKLETLLGVASASAHGYSADGTKNAFDKARELSRKLDNKPLLFRTIVGLFSYYLIRGVLPACLELTQQILNLAEQTDNSFFALIGHIGTGVVNFYMGDFAAALQYLNQPISYDPGNFRHESAALGWDPALVGACYKALALRFLGYTETAREHADNVAYIAHELASPFHAAFASGLLARFHMYGAEPDQALGHAESAIKVSTEYGFSHWLAVGMVTKGWAMVSNGRAKEGGTCLQQGIGKWRALGAERSMPDHSVLLAEYYLKARQDKEALRCIEEGLAISKKTGDSVYAAELNRLKGQVLRSTGNLHGPSSSAMQAEACFQEAIRTARRQHAKSLELRATVSLCRLWQETGKAKEAKRTLAKIYGWFTEGFDTPDLKAAKALLDELE